MSKLVLEEKEVKKGQELIGTLRVEVDIEHLKKKFKEDNLKSLPSDTKRLERMGYKPEHIDKIKEAL